MVKQRMTSLDVRASVEEMRATLLGLRLINIYDLSPTLFLFKFGQGERKYSVLLENGIRMHLTELTREKPRIPSQFTLKIRKHVRAWRLDAIQQLQNDRTVDLCFGVAGSQGCFHILVELFSQGNIVLTDHTYTIMMLLRTHKDKDVTLMVHSVYPVHHHHDNEDDAAASSSTTTTTTTTAKTSASAEKKSKDDNDDGEGERARRVAVLRAEWQTIYARQPDYETTRSTLSALRHFGNSLADHILAATQTMNVKKKAQTMSAEALFARLLPGMLEAWDIAQMPLPPGGYLIFGKNDKEAAASNNNTSNSSSKEEVSTVGSVGETMPIVHYDDFSPVLLAQYTQPGLQTVYRESFGKACEEYFLPTEVERIEHHNTAQQKTALSKREKFERDHARRITALEREQELNRKKGEMILLNADRIDEAIGLINGALAAGLQWSALRSLLKRRHAEGHPVAYMIHDLFLERNCISVLLEDELYDDEDDKDVPSMVVEVNLAKTAHANASEYFARKKANEAKLGRTLAATARAAAGAEHCGARTAAKKPVLKPIVQARSRGWWEKFFHFRTSAGDVVLRGKDTQSTEILVRKVMQLGDLFIYCDLDAALPCLLRPMYDLWCPRDDDSSSSSNCESGGPQPVMRASLEEAAGWCVSLSSAWETKQSVGAWWVYGSQVTGGAAAATNAFAAGYEITGPRHHILPQPLTLGCGLLFQVSRDIRTAPTLQEEEEEDKDKEKGKDKQEGRSGADIVIPAELTHARRLTQEEMAELRQHTNTAGDEDDGGSGGEVIAPDTASALPVLPAIETNRRHVASPPNPPRAAPKTASQANNNNRNNNNNNNNNSTKDAAARVQAGGAGEEARPAQGLTRHQKRKLKKIQSKYQDQDEEDRLYGAQLNGNQLARIQREQLQQRQAATLQAQGSQRTEPAAHEGASDSDSFETISQTTEDVSQDEAAAEQHADDMASDTPPAAEQAETEQNNSSSRADDSRAAQAATSLRAAASTATAHSNAELERALVHYTCSPTERDHITHVLVVCAPFRTLVSYRYRIELAAGNAKKGQVAQAILSHFGQLAAEKAKRAKHEAHAAASAEQRGDEDGSGQSKEAQMLSRVSVADFVEQLRGNAKPLKIRMQQQQQQNKKKK